MGRREETLIQKILNNPRDVRFIDACKVARIIGFTRERQKRTSHRIFGRPGEMTILNFQNRKGKIGTYQAEQLILMVRKYWNQS